MLQSPIATHRDGSSQLVTYTRPLREISSMMGRIASEFPSRASERNFEAEDRNKGLRWIRTYFSHDYKVNSKKRSPLLITIKYYNFGSANVKTSQLNYKFEFSRILLIGTAR